ncbi:28S ribosomal protein S18b, mitochondrial-like [Oppia nitens]|uniref:28S ribosomal protein S18b, mitochondrial-like n=1 Tax=Oppia nitens TaxID=1686743 RepID=UPI0023D9A11E|nr:28S ribosomal protein S18b, mitochondrial-like [Oppia nitens]
MIGGIGKGRPSSSTATTAAVGNQSVSKQLTSQQTPSSSSSRNFIPDFDHNLRQIQRERYQVISPETSIEYLKSNGYKQTYGHHLVWHLFRRNFSGQQSPYKSRGNCIIDNYVYTSNPCCICRDQYLVLHYTNLDLMKQFINPYSGYVIPNTVVCLCSHQYEQLLVAVTLAKDYGLLTFEMPLRTYDYGDYYTPKQLSSSATTTTTTHTDHCSHH